MTNQQLTTLDLPLDEEIIILDAEFARLVLQEDEDYGMMFDE